MTYSPLRFGANYTPSAGWMHWWLDPDFAAVARDFDALAALGVDHLRVFPVWPYIQPNRTLIRTAALAQLRRVVELAGERGMDCSVDGLQGHMSSFDFLPAWLTSWHERNMFTDPEAISGQRALIAALAEALADLPHFLGITTGNEVNQFSDDPNPLPQRCTPQQARDWLITLQEAAASAAPGKFHTHAEYDAVWYQDGHPFLPAFASQIGAATTVHSWVFNGTAQAYGPLAAQSVRHAEYLLELSKAFASDAGRPVWLQEVGAPLNCMSAAEAPRFAEATLRHAASSAGLWGVTWWCSHDVSGELADFPPLEYSLGLLDGDNRPKELGLTVARVMRELRDEQRRGGLGAARKVAVSIDADAGVPRSRAALGPRGKVFEAWMDLAAAGADPALVLADPASCGALSAAARGIEEIVIP